MNIKRIRYCLITFAAITLLASERAALADPKADLMNSLKGENVEGYLFSFAEEDARTRSALTNKAVRNIITLGKGA